MDSAPSHPWYRLHWLTWLALAGLLWTLVQREREAEPGLRFSIDSLNYMENTLFGWPREHLYLMEHGGGMNGSPTFDYDWNISNLMFNLLLCLLLTIATVHALEFWLRRPNRWQVTLGGLLGLTGVVAVLVAIVSGNIDASLGWLGLSRLYLFHWSELRQPQRWPLLFALGCGVYSLGWLTCLVVSRAWSLFRRSSRKVQGLPL